MSDDEDDLDTHCPLCVEEMDVSDRNFIPCPCGYRVSLSLTLTLRQP
jgi:CCR4-NOT transcription complex subunit 4